MINTYDFFSGNGQVLSIVDGVLSWIDLPKCCCDDGQTQRKKIYNCPNCGAPITRPRCEYCGTTFNLIDINYEKPKVIELRTKDYMCLQDQINTYNMQIALDLQTQFLIQNLNKWGSLDDMVYE